MTLPDPECKYGFTTHQLQEILGDRFLAFEVWMRGQTRCLCAGQPAGIDPNGRAKPEDFCNEAHGTVTYPWDLERYLALPIPAPVTEAPAAPVTPVEPTPEK